MSRCYECAEIDGFCTCQRDEVSRLAAERDAAIARADAAEAAIAAVRALVDTPKGISTLCICEYTDRLSECQDHLDLARILIRRALDTGATT